jgi:hypothetical protein
MRGRCLALLTMVACARAPYAQNAGGPLTAEAIQRQCVSGVPDYRECRVSEFAEVGRVGPQTIHYALYCVIPKESEAVGRCGDTSFVARYHRARAVSLFTRDSASTMLRPLLTRVDPDIGTLRFLKPEIVQSGSGTLLYVPIAVDGTGNYNSSEYYLREGAQWQRIESEAWLRDLAGRLPSGLEIWKGVWPDLRTMRATSGLWKKGDGNCCPTGGTARMKIAIRDRGIVLDSLVIDRRPPS